MWRFLLHFEYDSDGFIGKLVGVGSVLALSRLELLLLRELVAAAGVLMLLML